MTAFLPLTGSIGAAIPSSGTDGASGSNPTSNRRALPEQVTAIRLPAVERPRTEANKAQASIGRGQRGRKSRHDSSVASLTPVAAETQEDEAALSIEQSMILLQSLRQSRLVHLTALLPYLSTRHRTSTRYHAPPQGFPLPGGLDPAVEAPTLMHLGKVDVRVGPFVFPRTRIGEARVEGGVQDARGAALLKGQSDVVTPSKPISEQSDVEKGVVPMNGAHEAAAPRQSVAPNGAGKTPTSTPRVASPAPPKTSGMSTPTTTSNAIPAAPNSGSTTPSSSAPPPAINDKVVKAVSAAAQRDEALQRLLHSAANGKASPEQLRELAAFIAKVSEALEKAEKEASGSGASTPLSTPKGKGDANVKKEPKKRVLDAGTKAKKVTKKALAAEHASERIVPPPSAFSSTPDYPPMITVEFRENPSARFLLPLWRDAAVERREESEGRTIRITMLLPAIGSSAASRAAGDEDAGGGEKVGFKKKQKVKAKNGAGESTGGSSAEKIFSPMNPPSLEELRKFAPFGAETRPVTWKITGSDDANISDAVWEVFGRIQGSRTYIDGILQPDERTTADAAVKDALVVSYDVLSALIIKLRSIPAEHRDLARTPQFRIPADDVPKDLGEQLSDRFTPRIQTIGVRPIVRIKRTTGGEEEKDQFDVLRGMTSYDDRRKRVRIDGEYQDEAIGAGDDEVGDESTGGVQYDAVTGLPVKRKRHVAKYNPDGTLKLCQACGTNVTPMWRRGPAGKSTLCNACGAKWKVGRLVVPDKMPVAATEPAAPAPPRARSKATENESRVGDAEMAVDEQTLAPAINEETSTSNQSADISMTTVGRPDDDAAPAATNTTV